MEWALDEHAVEMGRLGPFAPNVILVADENLKGELRDGVQQRLERWMEARIAARLEPLIALRNAADAKAGTETALPGFARAIAHRMTENFGSLDPAILSLPEKNLSDKSTRCRKATRKKWSPTCAGD